jgi:NADH-quinone oxidoreductase subunit N
MASANHMLMVFLGVEMASVPSYALAGMLKGRRTSSEAALKYAVYGAGTAGIMLYGISLLAGVLGSVHLPTMAERLAELLQPANLEAGIGRDTHMVLALGALMVLVGVSFKLSAVPFHFWCPDVFEGATAEVNAFLSVASKAAALALLARVALGFGYIPQWTEPAPQVAMFNVAEEATFDNAEEKTLLAQNTIPDPPAGSPAAGEHKLADVPAPLDHAAQIKALAPVREFLWRVLAFVAVITCTFGNMAAYGQTNIKRLLAYSTIAQAGYMIMPVPAAMILAGENPDAARTAMASMAFYAGVYLFMNLGAFAIVALLRNQLHSEQIADYAGLVRRSPIIAVCFTIILISLIGLPPLAGFAGKLLIFSSLVQAEMWTVLVVAGLNTALSLYYYLRVVKIMTIDPEPEQGRAAEIAFVPGTYIVAITVPVVVLGLAWNRLNELSLAATQHLF